MFQLVYVPCCFSQAAPVPSPAERAELQRELTAAERGLAGAETKQELYAQCETVEEYQQLMTGCRAAPEEEDDPYPTEEDISGWFERCVKPAYTDDSSPTINQVLDHAQIQFEMEFRAGMTDEERAVSDILHRLHRAALRRSAAGEREDQARV